MTLSLLLICVSSALTAYWPPQLQSEGSPSPPMLRKTADFELFHRHYLEHARRSQAFMKDQFDWMEKFIDESPDLFSLESARASKRSISELRKDWEKGEEWLQALEYWDRERKLKPDIQTDWKAINDLGRLEEKLWGKGSRKPTAPPPHEAKK